MLSAHATVGLLLGLGALGVLVQAIRARRWAVIATSAVGLFAVAMLCYAVNLYLFGHRVDSP
jgi:hypothetical protein